MMRTMLLTAMLASILCASAMAGVKSKAAREAAEYVLKRFGKEIRDESVETLSERIGKYGTRYGDDAIDAIRKAGPRGFKMIDDAGENAPEVVKLLNRYGNDAVWVASKPGNLAIFVKYGDEAAEAMIKHPGVAASVVEEFGAPAARALRSVSGQNARRIAMMADDGSLAAANKADGILDVIGLHGDRAADWVWRHKASLAVASVAAAFIADPEPFLNGAVEVARIGGQTIVRPVTEKVAESINWNFIVAPGIAIVAVLILARFGWRWLIPRRNKFEIVSAEGSPDSS